MIASSHNIKSFQERIDWYGLQNDKHVNAIFLLLCLNPEDKSLSECLSVLLSNHPVVKQKDISRSKFATPMPRQKMPLDILIGQDESGMPVYFNAQYFTKGMLIGAATGYCKTIAIQIFQKELNQMGIRWISVDFKMDYQGIYGQVPMVVLFIRRDGNFKFNPLQVIPGVSADERDCAFVNALLVCGAFQEGARDYLLSILRWLRKQHKVINLYDLRKGILEDSRKGARLTGWKESSLRVISGLLDMFPSILDCDQGLEVMNLASDNNVILDLYGAGSLKSFWSTLLYAYTFLYRSKNNIRGNSAPLIVFFFDEANHLFHRKFFEKHTGDIPLILEVLQMGREFQIGSCLTSNTPSFLAPEVVVNTNAKLVMALHDRFNVETMSRVLMLNPEQSKEISSLKLGVGLFRQEGQETFPVNLDVASIKREFVSESRIISECALILDKYTPKINTPSSIIKSSEKEKTFSPDEEQFLLSVYKNPSFSKTEHFKAVSFTLNKGARVSEKLSKRNYLEDLAVNLGGSKKAIKALFLTDLAKKALRLGAVDEGVGRGEGKEHHFWSCFLARQLTNLGFSPEISKRMNGKEVDIGVMVGNELIAMELSVTTDEKHEAEQACKDIKAGFQKVYIFAKGSSKAEKIRSLIQKEYVQYSGMIFVSNLTADSLQAVIGKP